MKDEKLESLQELEDALKMKQVDREVIALCSAMNKVPGIHTIESCCGHGAKELRVWFKAARLQALPKLLYWVDG